MDRAVDIVGLGWSGFRTITPDLSYKEIVFEAASRAYADAGIDQRRDVQGFVTAAEDFHEGTSIFDEYTPDQLGVVRKAVYTVCGDFLQALGSAVMQINTGQYHLLAVSAFSKASNVLTNEEVLNFAYDPTLGRLGVTPHYLAGI